MANQVIDANEGSGLWHAQLTRIFNEVNDSLDEWNTDDIFRAVRQEKDVLIPHVFLARAVSGYVKSMKANGLIVALPKYRLSDRPGARSKPLPLYSKRVAVVFNKGTSGSLLDTL